MRFVQERIAAAFGITAEGREKTIAAMLEAGHGPAGGYWLQLITAMVIATLGLVLGSTAVVIGAMLVSPLMTPIVQLGMGLAIGSPLLVVRSAIRVAASCFVVVVGSSLVVLALPFHESTTEIAARTSPTVLDLAIASCCALAGLYAVIRPGSDTTSTAAGTAIGIALVPPLCVVGYGMGTGGERTAGGAGLLFTANFCAIILFAVIGFLLFGYGRVPIASLERAHADAFAETRFSGRVARRLSLFFASRASRVVRIAMPIALVLVVFVPLGSALGEVAWEVRVRAAVQEALRDIPGETVHSSVRIEDHHLAVRVVVIGDAERAARIRAALREQIARVAPEVDPSLEIASVPDSASLSRAEPALRDSVSVPAIANAANVHAQLPVVREDIARALTAWPEGTCGTLLGWNMTFAKRDGVARFTMLHLGQPLGESANEALRRSLAQSLGGSVELIDVALSDRPIVRDAANGEQWLLSATRELERVDALMIDGDALGACIALPRGGDAAQIARARESLASRARVGVVSTDSDGWMFQWATTPCGADAGATDVRDGGARDGAEDNR